MPLVEAGDLDLALECAQDLLRCLTLPVNIGWRERYMAEAHMNIYHIASSMMSEGGSSSSSASSMREVAHRNLSEAYRWNMMLQGERSEETIATRIYMSELGLLK